MTASEKRAYNAQKQREYRQRHAGDPEYRAKKKAADKRYREKNAEKLSAKDKAYYALLAHLKCNSSKGSKIVKLA